MVSPKNENTELINRLNRIQGQIEAIKKGIQLEEVDCMKSMQLLKAANNALKKFGEAYVTKHLAECVRKKNNFQDIEKDLKEVIGASFFL